MDFFFLELLVTVDLKQSVMSISAFVPGVTAKLPQIKGDCDLKLKLKV